MLQATLSEFHHVAGTMLFDRRRLNELSRTAGTLDGLVAQATIATEAARRERPEDQQPNPMETALRDTMHEDKKHFADTRENIRGYVVSFEEGRRNVQDLRTRIMGLTQSPPAAPVDGVDALVWISSVRIEVDTAADLLTGPTDITDAAAQRCDELLGRIRVRVNQAAGAMFPPVPNPVPEQSGDTSGWPTYTKIRDKWKIKDYTLTQLIESVPIRTDRPGKGRRLNPEDVLKYELEHPEMGADAPQKPATTQKPEPALNPPLRKFIHRECGDVQDRKAAPRYCGKCAKEAVFELLT